MRQTSSKIMSNLAYKSLDFYLEIPPKLMFCLGFIMIFRFPSLMFYF